MKNLILSVLILAACALAGEKTSFTYHENGRISTTTVIDSNEYRIYSNILTYNKDGAIQEEISFTNNVLTEHVYYNKGAVVRIINYFLEDGGKHCRVTDKVTEKRVVYYGKVKPGYCAEK